jgi:putative membrane protein
MSRFITHWFVVTVALAATAWILPGVRVESLVALVIGGLVLGLVNALVRPLLAWLTLPLTVVTLGLFYFVVNAAAFAFAAWLTPGFTVANLGSAILGAFLVSVVSWFIGQFVRDDRPPRDQRPRDAHA